VLDDRSRILKVASGHTLLLFIVIVDVLRTLRVGDG
jgi:hypothetical protein